MRNSIQGWIRAFKRAVKTKWRPMLSVLLAPVMALNGIPFLPGGGLPTAYAGTRVTVYPESEIKAVYGEYADISWIYTDPARDPITGQLLQTSHPTIVEICEGGSKQLATGDYSVLENHTIQWDGQFDDGFAKDGTYKGCVTPTDFPGEKGTTDIKVNNPNPPAPKNLEVLPNYTEGTDPYKDPLRKKKTLKIRGLAEINTEITLYYGITYREGDVQKIRPEKKVLEPVSGKILTKAQRTWSIGEIGNDASYFNGFPTRTPKTPTDFIGEWEAEIELKPYEIYHITAVATRIHDNKSSSESANYSILRYDSPDWNITWEALAGYYKLAKTVQAMVDEGDKIASSNHIEFKPCLGVDQCAGTIGKEWQLLIYEPKWAGAILSDELAYLSSVERISNPDKYPRPISLDPVNLATGDFIFSHTNLSVPARIPLTFEITYHSRDTYNGALGVGWHHSYEWRLERRDEGKIVVSTSEGASYEYTPLENGKFQAPFGTYHTLTRQGDGTYMLDMPNKWSYLFRQDGRLLRMTDPNGNNVNLSYTGTVLETVSTDGAQLQLHYADGGKIEKVVDHTGREVRYTYDVANHDLKSVTLPDDATIRFAYDNKHRITEIHNPNETATLTNTYDEQGRVVGQTDFRGVKGTIQYYPEQGKTVVTDAKGRQRTYEFDERYRQTAIHYADGSSEYFDYDAQDNLTLHVDRNGNKRTYSYDGQGNLLQAIDPSGAFIGMKYNEWSKPTEIVDALGNKTKLSYDTKGNLASIQDALGQVSVIESDERGTPLTMTNAKGETTRFANDSHGFVEWITDPSGAKLKLKRDPVHRVTEMVDALGGVTKLQYDGRDRIVSRTDALGHEETFRYDKDSNLTLHKDAAGAETRYDYTFDRISAVTDALGNQTTFMYNELGLLQSRKDPNGAVTEYEYNEVDRHVHIVMKDKNEQGQDVTFVTKLEYDAVGNVTKQTDRNGGVTEIKYDNRNLPIEVKDAAGAITNYSYDKLGRLVEETNTLGHKTSFEHDALGRLVKVTDAAQQATTYAYDQAGRLSRVTQPNGAEWQLKYDARGMLSSTVNPLGKVTQLERDALGRVTASKDEAGNTTSYGYDALGRVTSIIHALGHTTTLSYDPLGRVKQITDAKNRNTTYDYDALGRLLKVTNALGNPTSYAYDAVGNLTGKTDALGRVTRYEYNLRGLLTKQMNPLNETTSLQYDGNGNVLSVTHPDQTATRYLYDAVNRLTQIDYEGAEFVQYTYDAIGRRTSMVDPLGTTTYKYDVLDRLTEVTDAKGKSIRYEWTPTVQRSQVTYPDGGVVKYGYDLMGRLTEVTDAQGQKTSYSYDARGLLTSKTLPTLGGGTYSYDALGQLLEMTHSNRFGHMEEQLLYAYDPVGNRIRTERLQNKNDDDDHEDYDDWDDYDNHEDNDPYDDRNDHEDHDGHNDHDKNGGPDDHEDYDDHDDDRPRRIVTEYAYDAINQLTKVQKYNKGQYLSMTTAYDYDAVGNRLNKTKTSHHGKEKSEAYTYNAADRLTRWQRGAYYKDYAYDMRGNLLTVTGLIPHEDDDDGDDDHERLNRTLYGFSDQSVSHNVYGTVTQDVYQDRMDDRIVPFSKPPVLKLLEQYTWNSANRLVKHVNPEQDISQYAYDGDGNRVKMTVGEGRCSHDDDEDDCDDKRCEDRDDDCSDRYAIRSYDDCDDDDDCKREFHYTNDVSLALPEPLMVTGANARKWKQTYVYGARGERLSMTSLSDHDDDDDDWHEAFGSESDKRSKTQWYLNDALGSAIGLIGKDGRISSRFHYDEFGLPLDADKFDVDGSGPVNLFGYTGLGYDYYSELTYARARYYKPEIGRFVNEDTYKGSLWSPQSQNLYGYVHNNPLRFIDPSGHMPHELLNDFLLDFIGGKNDGTHYTDWELANAVFNANGNSDQGRYKAFHEIAQIHAAKKIHEYFGVNTTLEFHLEEEIDWWPNKHHWVDIVTGDNQMWEVKAMQVSWIGGGDGGSENAEEQLTKYQSLNSNHTRGAMLDDILGVEIVDDLRMDISFTDKGKIQYSFYLDMGQGRKKVIPLTTSQAEDYVENSDTYPPSFDLGKKKKGRRK